MIGGTERATIDLYACGDCESIAMEKVDINRHKGHVLFSRRVRGTEAQVALIMHKARMDMMRQFSPKGFKHLRVK